MIAVTVARALALPLRLLCVPRSALTAVVIRAYGPFTRNPSAISSPVIQHSKTIMSYNDTYQ